MSSRTNIQWAHSTVNPVMGCDGCELYPTFAQIRESILKTVLGFGGECGSANRMLDGLADKGPQYIKVHISQVATQAVNAAFDRSFHRRPEITKTIETTVSKMYVCYAATLHRFFNGSGKRQGYAYPFERPTCFSGRVQKVSLMPQPGHAEVRSKPWLIGFPRMIFISDMGDAFSHGVSFEFLLKEVVRPVSSAAGRRHIWLWLSKRPQRMAEFSNWLQEHGVNWPDNLVAMTTVTGPQFTARVSHLRKVKARFRGLSLEPLWAATKLPLDGIGWVIVGGQSGANARPFEADWARQIRDDCRRSDAALFVKQLGRNPHDHGQHLNLADKHGGDWSEWPADVRIREVPAEWRHLGQQTNANVS